MKPRPLRDKSTSFAKLEIALKECNECDYWLNLLKDTDSIVESDLKPDESVYQSAPHAGSFH